MLSKFSQRKLPAVLQQRAKSGERSCGECGLCCMTHGVDFGGGVVKPALQWCEHWSNACKCAIYSKRPAGCRNFECDWLKGIGMDNHRPDKTGIVLDLISEPRIPNGAILQMWEGIEGALASPFATLVKRESLTRGVLVSHLHQSGQRKIFVPSIVHLTERQLAKLAEEQFEVVPS